MRELGGAIYRISLLIRLYRTIEQSSSSETELSEREILLMEFLGNKGELQVGSIGDFFKNLGASTISMTVSSLAKRKLLNKEFDPEDHRKAIISLSPKGKQLLEKIKDTKAQSYKELISALALTKQEKDVFEESLQRAINHFEEILLKG